jgi:ubiquinol-cytochrome c reductase cytochrome c1 subunit
MSKHVAVLALALLAAPALASEQALPYSFKSDTGNKAALQRGAAAFMGYCAGCHGLKYLRYNRIAKDLGIPEELMKDNLMPPGAKPGDHVLTAMPPASKDPTAPSEPEKWFGKAPPDLSLTARERGASWVYSYLLSFYLDPKRPSGVNNTVFPMVSMPHVLGDLQGYQAKVEEKPGEGEEHGHGKLELVSKGSMTPEQYKEFVGDLTNFLVYAAEPGRNHRVAIGVGSLIFLVIFGICAYLLKLEYWKDVH